MTTIPSRVAPQHSAADDELEIRRRVAALSLSQKARLVTGSTFWTVGPEPAAGLQELVLSDGPAGVRGQRWDERDTSANVPTPIALAATWDRAQITSVGELLASEAREKGVHVLLAPAINLHRSPVGGRNFEYLSEDPTLTGDLAAVMVRALQSNGIAATVKHFVANDSETERFTADVVVDERTLRELYLAPFRETVEAGAWSVMAAYNLVNGEPMTQNDLLRDVLREEWGFDGVTMSDWYAVRTVVESGNAALDLAMPGPASPWSLEDALERAVQAGEVSEAEVDEKVTRILRLAARVGVLDGFTGVNPSGIVLSQKEISGRLREAASAGMVLLKNEGELEPVLPLSPRTGSTLAVVGPGAVSGRTLGGGSATVYPTHVVSPLDGLLAAVADGVRIEHVAALKVGVREPLAPWDWFTTPDGEPGVETRFVAEDGTVLGSERRENTLFKWLGDFMPGIQRETVGLVEVRGIFNPPSDGEYRIGVSGLGHFQMTIGSELVLDEVLALPEGGDPIEGLIRPPQKVLTQTLKGGVGVLVVVRHPVASDSATTKIELNLAAPEPTEDEGIAQAVELAARSDTAIVIVGTNAEIETESMDRANLSLPGRQDELIRRVAAANPRTIVVVNAGAPVVMPWLDRVAAVLLTWFPGQEYGSALADVIFGAAEPGGRLPLSWPAIDDKSHPSTRPDAGLLHYREGIRIGYRDERRRASTAFAFGEGRGYTSFKVNDSEITTADDGSHVLGVVVENTGRRRGKFVGQVYASTSESVVDRPSIWLVAFEAVELEAGERRRVDFVIRQNRLDYFDAVTRSFLSEQIAFRFHLGTSSQRILATVEVVSTASTDPEPKKG